MSKNSYSWADKFPTLTELFFGKDNPATYAPSYLSGKGKTKPVATKKAPAKKVDISKAITDKKPVKEATAIKPRGTNKDLKSQEMLKKLKTKKA